jgi:hypothetical protein
MGASSTLAALSAAALWLLPAAVQGQMCKLTVPAAPLTAAGLATPYILTGCDQAGKDFSVFVEATILNRATGELSVYAPLVINAGTQPAAPPSKITLTADHVVGIWFGANDNVALVDDGQGSLAAGLCM